MVPQGQQQSSVGYKVALSGGILSMLAFLILPYVSIGIFGSYTAIQLANGIFGFSSPILWLELVVALAIVGLSSFSLYNKGINTTPAVVIAGLSGITLLVLGLIYLQQSMQRDPIIGSVASYYALGFWLYIAGIMAALAGGILQSSLAGQRRSLGQQPPPFQQPQQSHWSSQPPPQSP